MPKHLGSAARKEWKRLLPMLLERGSLTEGDASVLALLCETHARWLAAKRDVELNGMMVNVTTLDSSGQPITNRKINPALKVAEAAERALRGFLVELGLTPRSRDRALPVRKPKNEAKSSFDAFIEANRK